MKAIPFQKTYKSSIMKISIIEYKNKFAFDFRNISLFIFLALLPNLLGLINLPSVYGFKIHFFQLGVFIATLVYGTSGGFAAGFF
jgi:hypothetical protein